MSSKNKSAPSTASSEKQFYVQSVAPEELSDYMFVLSMILGAAAMFVKVLGSAQNICQYINVIVSSIAC